MVCVENLKHILTASTGTKTVSSSIQSFGKMLVLGYSCCQRGKTSAMILEAILAAHQCGNVCQNTTVNVFTVWD